MLTKFDNSHKTSTSSPSNLNSLYYHAIDSLSSLWVDHNWRDYFVKGGIVATAVLVGVIAAHTGDDQLQSQVVRGTIGAGIGFFMANRFVRSANIQQCYELQEKTKSLHLIINEKLELLSDCYDEETPNYNELVQLIQIIKSVNNSTFDPRMDSPHLNDMGYLQNSSRLLSKIDKELSLLWQNLSSKGLENAAADIKTSKQRYTTEFPSAINTKSEETSSTQSSFAL